MKKTLIVLVILLVLAGAGFFFLSPGKKDGEEAPSPVPTEPSFVETSLAERPFVSLTPSADGHWLFLSVSRIQNAETLEYELTYNTSGKIEQGTVGGPFDLNGTTTYQKKILLGTESSGHYRYHERIERGELMVRLEGGPGPRKFEAEFHLQSGVDELTSISDEKEDGKFVLSADFPASGFYVTMSTIGLPDVEVADQVLAGPYGVFTLGEDTVKNGEVKFSTSDDGQIFLWEGGEWTKIEKSDVSQVGVFVLAENEE